VINQPTRGVGEKTLEHVRQHSRMTGLSLWQAAQQILQNSGLTARAGNAVKRFMDLINQMSAEIDGLSLDQQVKHVIELSGLKEHYQNKEKGEKGQARVENLNELVTAAQGFRYDPEEEHADMDFLSAFLSHAVLESGEGQSNAHDDCVQMMTLHTAKGLEFPMVFLAGMEEGLFPHQMSIQEPGRLEEERRLCYVGITRARKQLVISYAEQRRLHGNIRYNAPSRFVEEIPESLLNMVRPSVTTWQPDYQSAQGTASFSRQNKSTSGLNIGQAVRHPKFGDGIVTDQEGSGSHARVQVHFDTEGSKWLVVNYARLEIL